MEEMIDDVPEMNAHEQWEMRKYLAISHEDGGKCRIYGDDGELQCGNILRHGRTIDFRREKVSDLLSIVELTRMKECGIFGDVKYSPAEIERGMNAKANSDITSA